jgi:hypothetical protein
MMAMLLMLYDKPEHHQDVSVPLASVTSGRCSPPPARQGGRIWNNGCTSFRVG